MLNPSYLIRSRHAIYYFRYPLLHHGKGRISVSLNTRCPKEALRLSKALEYHAYMVMSSPKTQSMDYAEIKEVLRNHFAEVLERMKKSMDKDGPLSVERAEAFKRLQADAQYAIEHDQDDLHEHLFNDDDIPKELSLDKTLQPIAERYGLSLDNDNKEYAALRREYKHALDGYIDAVLSYSDGVGFYAYDVPAVGGASKMLNRSELKLTNVIEAYLKEYEGQSGDRAYREKRDCAYYLTEAVGQDSLITDIDYSKVRAVKDMLVNTPSNRSKLPETKDLSLKEQIEIAKNADLKLMSDTNVNKYLGYMSGLFEWARQNKYVSENPFKGVKVKTNQKKVRRKYFDKTEVTRILDSMISMDTSKALDKTRYWAALLYIYTGARLNEIASLTPDDIIQDDESGIHYIRITDEEEGKKVKSKAGKRVVPVHSKLLDLGFLNYVKHAREVIAKRPKTDEYPTRLLYALTYRDEVWGRKVGRWFNNTFLPKLDLKEASTSLHSLRHSFITYLDVAKVDASTIMSMAGHEQGTVTYSTYTHYGVQHLPKFKEAIEKLPY